MKFSSEVIINLPRDRVIELFDDPKNLKGSLDYRASST